MRYLLLIAVITTAVLAGPKRGEPQSVAFLWDLSATDQTSGTFTVSPVQGSIPVSAVITNMTLHVVEPLTSSTNASVTIGNSASSSAYAAAALYSTYTDNYTKNAGQLASAALWDDTNDVAVPYLVDGSTKNDLKVVVANALTGGKIYFWFEYFVPGEY